MYSVSSVDTALKLDDVPDICYLYFLLICFTVIQSAFQYVYSLMFLKTGFPKIQFNSSRFYKIKMRI